MPKPPNLRLELDRFERTLKRLRGIFNSGDPQLATSLSLTSRDEDLQLIDDLSYETIPYIIDQHASNKYQNSIVKAWNQFTNYQTLDETTPPIIANSWKRCWALINPLQERKPARLSENHLLSSQVASFYLISIARPVIEDIRQNVNQPGLTIVLTNGAGCVLDMVNDSSAQNYVSRWGISLGVFLTEELMGTNAIGLALTERMPIQVNGAEHYVRQLHDLICAAAPIFAPTGSLLGTLSILMPLANNPTYLLGLVVIGAKAIENQYQADLLLEEHNQQIAQMSTIISAISDGILVWNSDQILIHVNQSACKIIGLPSQSLVGQNANTVFKLPESVSNAIAQNKLIEDVEVTLPIDGVDHSFLISTNYINLQNRDRAAWTIVILRTEKKVRNLVQQQMGARALLTLDDIPGESHQIRHVRNMVQNVAGAQASILIRGETGTGKNALANAIHNASSRRDGPFIIFSASSIPNELVVSELLGVEDDASGKLRGSRPSKFELAQGGTLFFQDIDNLPLEAQSVLLNVLEMGIVQRIRGQRAIHVDARILASSTANLDALITQGGFRSDLYYRLSSFLIDIPPLRERPNDIPLVVDRILKRLSIQLNKQLKLANGLIDILKKAHWAGNVREIEAVLTRAATQTDSSGVIELKMLPITLTQARKNSRQYETETRFLSIHELERSAILKAAQLCQGNLTLMAKSLGLSRTTLWRRLKTLGIEHEQLQSRHKDHTK